MYNEAVAWLNSKKQATSEHAAEVVAIAQRICRDYTQEAVTVEYNGQVKFVTAE